MSKVTIAHEESGKAVQVDVERLIETRLLIQANSGGGKSYSIRKLLESTHGKIQQIVLDVEGEFATLREKYDYILAGKGGDIPADVRSAELLARKALELGVSMIVDLYELKAHERARFVKLFLDSMMNAPKDLWHPVLVVLDEVHLFAPEKGESEASGAVIDLATRGRKRGFCIVPATQRLSKLHKDVAAECLNKMIGRTTLDIDRKRAGDELGFMSQKDTLALRNLDPGQFYIFGPAISKDVHLARIEKVHTAHPKSGHRIGGRAIAPTAKIKSILQKLTDLPKEAEEELRDREAMKTKIRELERELRTAQSHPRVETKIEKIVDEKAIERALRATKKEIAKHVLKLNYTLSNAIGPVVEETIQKCNKALNIEAFDAITPSPPKAPAPARVQHTHQATKTESDNRTLSACERKILGFLAAYPDRVFSKTQVAVMSGYSQTSSSFSNAVAGLNAIGLIKRESGGLRVHPGVDVSEFIDLVPHSLKDWENRLGACERKIYELVQSEPSTTFAKESIAEVTGYSVTSSSFSNALAKLNTLGLVRRESGGIRLNPEVSSL